MSRIILMFRNINIGSIKNQAFDILLDNGEIYSIILEYEPYNFVENDIDKIGYWFITLTYNNITVCTKRKIVLSANILDFASNLLPYGIAIISKEKIEPISVYSFLSTCKFYLVSYDIAESLLNDFYE
jgi:hypothetical protein